MGLQLNRSALGSSRTSGRISGLNERIYSVPDPLAFLAILITSAAVAALRADRLRLELDSDFPEQLDAVALWDGSPLPPRLHARLLRDCVRLGMLCRQIRGLEQERRELLRTSEDESVERVRKAARSAAVGINSAGLFVMEFFGWREFRNRRQVGALAGLVAAPFSRGESEHEFGISKAGSPQDEPSVREAHD